MGKFQDLTGQKFGRLKVIKRVENKGRQTMWLCKCDCGNEKIVRGSHLINGYIKSCGCLNKEILRQRCSKHLQSKTRLHQIWLRMKQRCVNKNLECYKNYGGRGITVCDDWKNDFMSFYSWSMQNGYKNDLSIDRIDNNGNYEPSNCRWADRKTQARNTRSNRLITYNGQTHCISEWAEILNISKTILQDRISQNWSIEKTFKTPVRLNIKKVKCIDTNKIYNSIKEASNDNNINRASISFCCVGKYKTAGGLHWEYV